MKYLHYFEALNKSVLVICSIILVLLLGVMDYLTGFEFSFSLFYLLPVAIAAWYINRNFSFFISGLSALTWFLSNGAAGESYTHPAIGYWNTLVRLGFFTLISFLLNNLKQSLERERDLSRIDFITGITNSRAFYDLANIELLRSYRYKHYFSVAYIDIDDFKQVNDRLGHNVGDKLLRVIAETLRTNLRRTDIAARMGGDEFILFLPEANEQSARATFTKVRASLLEAMKHNHWSVTFSIGAVTFRPVPIGLDDVIRQVDGLMYEVKANGKNNIRFGSAG